jgi:hypothetical protein
LLLLETHSLDKPFIVVLVVKSQFLLILRYLYFISILKDHFARYMNVDYCYS